jgi:hypothetical protein
MFALLAASLLSAGLTLDGSVRAEGRAGAIVAGQDPRATAVAVELNGRTSGPDAVLLFGILPSAVFARDNQLFARGYLEADLRLGRDGWLRARQRGSYGTADFSPIGLLTSAGGPPGTPLPVQSPPTARFIQVEESSSTLELEMLATRRLRLLAAAAWNVSGQVHAGVGVDRVLPLSRGPQARALLEWAATRLDTLKVETTGFDTRYSNGNRVSVGKVVAGWRTTMFRDSELAVAAGAGAGRAALSTGGVSTLPYAVATVDGRFAATRDLALALGAGLEPSGDPLTGDLIERGTLRGSAVWGGIGKISVAAHVAGSLAATSGSLAVNGVQAGDKFLQGDLILSLPVTRSAAIEIGGRGAWLSRPLPGQPDKEWIAFAGFSAQLPLLR